MVLLLVVDVLPKRVQPVRGKRKSAIPPLPREPPQFRRLRLQPFRRGRLELFDQLRGGHRPGHPDGKMHMIPDTPDAVAFTPDVSRHHSKVGMKSGTQGPT
jgi:hypothetical protein